MLIFLDEAVEACDSLDSFPVESKEDLEEATAAVEFSAVMSPIRNLLAFMEAV